MIILLMGASHTGKTLLAQRILETCHYPYLSLDHLKMGLIRSGNTDLTVFDDDKLTEYLWPIAREIVKTAVENNQNLVVEGCYIPFDWKKDFEPEYLAQIRGRCLVMTEDYIRTHFGEIRSHANAIERRLDDGGLDMEEMIRENQKNLRYCRQHGCEVLTIDRSYSVDLSWVGIGG